jgi:hypothetical protein
MFLDTLPPHAQEALTRLGREPLVEAFYLAGGSAVALHLGHRISIDLDFFTTAETYETEALIQKLRAAGPLAIHQQGPGTLIGTLSGVRLSFFAYPYPLLEKTTRHAGVQIASLLDLALMKVVIIGQRGKKRDFVDLYFLCQKDLELGGLLARVPEKFPGVTYPSYHLLRALAYFADAEGDEMPRLLAPFDWEEAKRFFAREVTRLMGRL